MASASPAAAAATASPACVDDEPQVPPPLPLPQPLPAPEPLSAPPLVVQGSGPCARRVALCVAPPCPSVVVIQHAGCGTEPARPPGPDPGPTPFAGFIGRGRTFQTQLELGYPFMDLAFSYAFSERLALGVGLRTLYSMTYAPYATLRLALRSNASRTAALSLALRVGYTWVRGSEWDRETRATLVGGTGAFGEAGLGITARKRKNGLFVNAGVRLSQARLNSCAKESQWACAIESVADEQGPALATLFVDMGVEARLSRHASYFFGFGVDLFVNGNDLPAMLRFRNGVIVDF